MTTRETAAERAARYAEEAEVALMQFEAEKPLRLLKVLARAQRYGVATYFYCDQANDDVRIRFSNDPYDPTHHQFYYRTLSETGMITIESSMDALDEELKEKERLEELKKMALAKLTKEEQQLLGLA